MNLIIRPPLSIKGTIDPPGDKSISHRAAIIGALAEGETRIDGFLEGADCLSTLKCLRDLGVVIEGPYDGQVIIRGKGLNSLKEPETVLDAGNSGTTMRLLSGVLAGQSFYSVITGDESLRSRPMGRVTKPLRSMGAKIWGRLGGDLAPLSIQGNSLTPIKYTLPVASAQVKSALLLAGLFANGETVITEPHRSRDHSERMLKAAGADITIEDKTVRIKGQEKPLKPLKMKIPGDISGAAFFLVAGCIVPRGIILLKDVNLNPTRTGILEVLKAMGAQITVTPKGETSGEPIGDIEVSCSNLQGTEVNGELIPRLIDEIPVLAVAATQAKGKTIISDAAELKFKETDRISLVAKELIKMGADILPQPDGLLIKGSPLHGAVVDTHGDHRLGMTLAVAALVAKGVTVIRGAECINISYPNFAKDMERLGVEVREED